MMTSFPVGSNITMLAKMLSGPSSFFSSCGNPVSTGGGGAGNLKVYFVP